MENTSLTLTHQYDAPVSAVFQAWADPELIAKWFSPTPEMKVEVQEYDFREGGAYKVNMKGADGDNIAYGVFSEIVENEKIVMTWQWKNWPNEQGNSEVTALFAEKNDGTELTLTHEKLASQESVEMHTQGWQGCLARLPEAL